MAATSTERCVSGEGGTLHPVFSVVPEIRSSAPDIGYVRSLGPLFVPPSGHKFVVVKLKNLELRCFAFNCELRYHGSDVRLAWMFRYGDDPIEETAERLYTLAAEEAGKPAEWFQELKSSRPQEHDRWIRIARLLLFAVPRGVPASQLRELLRQEVDEDLGESTARRFQDWLIYKVHQELRGFSRRYNHRDISPASRNNRDGSLSRTASARPRRNSRCRPPEPAGREDRKSRSSGIARVACAKRPSGTTPHERRRADAVLHPVSASDDSSRRGRPIYVLHPHPVRGTRAIC